jgi:hypothetical protein
MKNLPVGIQSFGNIRKDNYLYVDKTEYIYRMVTTGRIYFLSRPRRFGKSLTVDTLEALFTGRKEWFEGLYIYDKWDWETKYPVIRIDWSQITCDTPKDLERSITGWFRTVAADHGIGLTAADYPVDCFRDLIAALYRKTGRQTVILIDEYDVPILHVTGKSDEDIKAMQETLHNIYKVMKGSDPYIRFIFLTGVSRFAGLSVFSALNNPKDITLSEKYAALCGITQEELENNFPEYLNAASEELSMPRRELLTEIRKWYNGYSWDGKTSVYNPFSVLLFLEEKKFKSYWFATGTPTFLITLLKKRNSIESFLHPIQATEAVFSAYDPGRLETLPLLFQTGYLTITKITAQDDDHSLKYTFEPPNNEVRKAFIAHLAQAYTEISMNEMSELHDKMQHQLKTLDSEGLERSLRAMLAHVPYQLHIASEKYYHSLLLVWFYFLGFKPLGELPTHTGRIDVVWKLPGINIITEIKYSVNQPLAKLLAKASGQIRARKYYEACMEDPGKIILVSIAISGREPGCRIETLTDE